MKNIILTVAVFALMAASRATEKPNPPRLPSAQGRVNIIYINADDLGVMDVGFMGCKEYNTPNLDRMAAEGMVFTEAYAPAANCAPSRACVISGQYGGRHGVYTVGTSERGKSADRKLIPTRNKMHLPEENVTMAEALKAGGYKTIHLGKWHLGEDPTTQGFDINIGGGRSGSPYGGYFAPFKGPMARYNGPYGKGTHSGDIFADQAVTFLKSRGDTPFFMHMAYYLVHTPIQKVPGLVEKYADRGPTKAAYASMVEKMDQSIGAILDELDAQGLKENTLVLFTSDNGGIRRFSKQDPYRSGKGSYFEGGIREPLVVRWPGRIKAGSTCNVPVIGIDFYPTFLDAAGLQAPAGKILDGVSLLPLLTGTGSIEDRPLFWHFPVYLQTYAGAGDDSHDPLFRTRPGSAMRSGKWKLHEYFEDGRLELYDLGTDAGERRNLAEEMPEKAEELHAKLKEWRAELDCPVPTELNPKYEGGPLASAPRRTKADAARTAGSKPASVDTPNVVYILADDLGYGDLGCYGQKKLKTPNIDRLATEGIRFTDHYSGNTVCSPSRANLMTGQHPGHVHCRGNAGRAGENSMALDPAMTTLPRLFKNAGYATGAFGKWGLGITCDDGAPNPLTHGFDTYSGWKSQMIAHTYYPTSIVRDGKEIPLEKETYIHDLIMADALDFIRRSIEAGKPFFCYIPTAVPHAAMHAPPELHEKWRKVYPQFDQRIGRYGAGPGEPCPPVTNPIAGYAAMMENLDNQVAELLALLKELGVDKNTLVTFSSDNGAHSEGGHDPNFWDSNGPLRGIKRDLYDGGIRTPFVARWPGRIKPGTESDHISAFWDVLPTMAELTGQPLPEQTDGISFLPTLLGQEKQQHRHKYLYWEHRANKPDRAVRMGKWKAVEQNPKGKGNQPRKLELFDLTDDLGEQKDVAAQHPEIVERIRRIMNEAHTPLQ